MQYSIQVPRSSLCKMVGCQSLTIGERCLAAIVNRVVWYTFMFSFIKAFKVKNHSKGVSVKVVWAAPHKFPLWGKGKKLADTPKHAPIVILRFAVGHFGYCQYYKSYNGGRYSCGKSSTYIMIS